MKNMLKHEAMASEGTHTGNVSYYFCQTFSSFKIKKKPNTPITAAAAEELKSNSSSKQAEYKLMVGCCRVGHNSHNYKCCPEKISLLHEIRPTADKFVL